MKRDNGESQLQVAFFNWYPFALPEITAWHVRNQNSENEIQGSYMKKLGVRAGVHDVHIIGPNRLFATMEFKNPNLRPTQSKYSDTQQSFGESMDRCGFRHACCQNGAQIVEFIKSLGLNPRIPFPCLGKTNRKQVYMNAWHEMNLRFAKEDRDERDSKK